MQLPNIHITWLTVYLKGLVADKPTPHKIPLIFYRTRAGREPVREWLQRLDEAERQVIGKDLLRAQ